MIKEINNSIKLLEQITGKHVLLKEATEADKNMAVEALQALSESMDMVKQNLQIALDKVNEFPNDVAMTKLRGLNAIIDTNMTEIAEMIATFTGTPTKEDALDMHESLNEEEDEKGIEMPLDRAIKDVDSVKKVIDQGLNVIIDDE